MQHKGIENAKPNKEIYRRFLKRPMDFMFSSIALIVFSPLLLFVAILIKVGSEGPVFFRQERPGKDQEIFKVFKFRTMVKDAVKQQKVGVEVTRSDTRITPYGNFLRRFKIDELAQLINILIGDMSLVGPRPTLPEYIELYEKWELKRFDVRPGLTGLAQINGNIYLERQEKSAYDVKYIEDISFASDLRIIIKTVAIVFLGEDKFVNKIESRIRGENSKK